MKKQIFAGLTGGIASGKSAAADMFAAAGAYIIDTDVLSRVAAESAEGKAALVGAFPSVFTGETLNRRALRALVFSDTNARERLNGILHPLIAALMEKEREQTDAAVVIAVVPLLFETDFHKRTYPNITVSCDARERIKRLCARDAIDETLAKKMLAAQLSDAAREARADIVLRNDGSLAQLRAQVVRVYCELCERAQGG